jgi:hypothetical protein
MVGTNDRVNGNERGLSDLNIDYSLSQGRFFEIHIKGQLDSDWSEWLENMEVNLLESGEMILFGPISDQAALMGVLNKLNRLNLTILSLNEVVREE